MFVKIDDSAAFLLGMGLLGAASLVVFPEATVGVFTSLVDAIVAGIEAVLSAV